MVNEHTQEQQESPTITVERSNPTNLFSMDLLTQLQDEVCHLSELFGMYIGVLQRDAPPVPVLNPSDPAYLAAKDAFSVQAVDMATSVIQTSKKIEQLIEALPGVNRTESQQHQKLMALEKENKEANEQLQKASEEAQQLLADIRKAIRDISERAIEV